MAEHKIDSATLYKRVAELEKSLADSRAKIASAEEELTSMFAEGKDPKAAQAALNAARSDLADRIEALGRLESRAHTAAVEEHRARRKVIEQEGKALYDKTVLALLDALDTVKPAFASAGLPDRALAELAEGARESLWTSITAKGAERIKALGPAPTAPLARDADGRQVNPEAQFLGPASHRLSPAEVAAQPMWDKFNSPGSAGAESRRARG